MATAIASDSLNCQRNRKEYPQREENLANVGIFEETTQDPKVEGSRSQQRSVTDHTPLSDCTETQ